MLSEVAQMICHSGLLLPYMDFERIINSVELFGQK
jgi:hypothetical protein